MCNMRVHNTTNPTNKSKSYKNNLNGVYAVWCTRSLVHRSLARVLKRVYTLHYALRLRIHHTLTMFTYKIEWKHSMHTAQRVGSAKNTWVCRSSRSPLEYSHIENHTDDVSAQPDEMWSSYWWWWSSPRTKIHFAGQSSGSGGCWAGLVAWSEYNMQYTLATDFEDDEAATILLEISTLCY